MLSHSVSKLAGDLLPLTYHDGKGLSNVALSPLSIAIALSMIANGARGDTSEAISQVLGIETSDLPALNSAVSEYLDGISINDESWTIAIANAIFAKSGYCFDEDFLAVGQSHFQAEIEELDFQDDPAGAADHINSWCKEKTNGLIPSIVGEIQRGTAMYLLSALHFLCPWASPFNASETKLEPFTLTDGSVVEVPIMHLNERLSYAVVQGAQVVTLPYDGYRFEMIVVLPEAGLPIGSIVSAMSGDFLASVQGALEEYEVELSFPKFNVSLDGDLVPALTELGLGVAFDVDLSDFGGIVHEPDRAVISEVKHKVVVKVDEQGTEAAAVTSIVMAFAVSMPEPVPSVVVKVDRPFFFFIRDTWNDTPLFIGAVVDPRGS